MPHRAPDTRSLQALLELHDEPVVLFDSEYTIVAANSAYVESYASPGANLLGNKCHRVSHLSEVPCHQRGEDCPVKRVMTSGKPVDTLHIHFNGGAVPERVRVRGFPIKHQGQRPLAEKIQRLDPLPSNPRAASQMVGNSPAFLTLLHRLVQVSAMPGSVLLQGESGVGKELAARFVHEHGASSGSRLSLQTVRRFPIHCSKQNCLVIKRALIPALALPAPDSLKAPMVAPCLFSDPRSARTASARTARRHRCAGQRAAGRL